MGNITSKGQVTLPARIREFLGVHPGDRVDFRIKGGIVVVEPETVDVRDLYNSVKTRKKNVTIEMMDDSIKNRYRRK